MKTGKAPLLFSVARFIATFLATVLEYPILLPITSKSTNAAAVVRRSPTLQTARSQNLLNSSRKPMPIWRSFTREDQGSFQKPECAAQRQFWGKTVVLAYFSSMAFQPRAIKGILVFARVTRCIPSLSSVI